jgi:hypothetical protein
VALLSRSFRPPRHLLRRGVTLIEAVLFIAVALTLIVGGLVFYDQARVSMRTAESARVVSAAIAAARTVALKGDRDDWTCPDIVPVLRAGGYLPVQYIDELGIRVPWSPRDAGLGSTTDIEAGFWCSQGGLTYPGPAVYIEAGYIDPRICMRILTVDANGNGRLGPGMLAIRRFGRYHPRDIWFDGVMISDTGGVTAATAAEVCKPAARFNEPPYLLLWFALEDY